VQRNYIFLDTFILCNFTKNNIYKKLVSFIQENDLIIVISELSFVELYNPNFNIKLNEKDRTQRISKLLSVAQFVIFDYKLIWDKEVKAYPDKLKSLPIKLTSNDIFKNNIEQAILKLFRNEYMNYGVNIDISKWAKEYDIDKKAWAKDVDNIINNAVKNGTLKKNNNNKIIRNDNAKKEFVESLDLRFCKQFTEIKKCLDNNKNLKTQDREYVRKLSLIFNNHDTYKMEGTHLTSLAFWYEYIKQQKKIHGSDLGDFAHITFIPYCKYAVLDNSRNNMFQQIKKQENLYKDVKVHNTKGFMKLIN